MVSPKLGCLPLMDLAQVEVPHYVSEAMRDVGEDSLRKSLNARYSDPWQGWTGATAGRADPAGQKGW
jgi:hypothetical protein